MKYTKLSDDRYKRQDGVIVNRAGDVIKDIKAPKNFEQVEEITIPAVSECEPT